MERVVHHTPSGEAVTDLILEVFRLNGRLLAAGDRLVAPLGLTSARWQVLGAVAMAPHPGPVPHLARAMGLSRQNVRRIADDLAAAGLLRFAPNPHHRRAKLVLLTERGREVFAAARRLQAPWADGLGDGLDPGEVRAALDTLRALRARLDGAEGSDGEDDVDA
jgi:DNA-binding MarR family transcriptional regulator